jgi:hypothetical protein
MPACFVEPLTYQGTQGISCGAVRAYTHDDEGPGIICIGKGFYKKAAKQFIGRWGINVYAKFPGLYTGLLYEHGFPPEKLCNIICNTPFQYSFKLCA